MVPSVTAVAANLFLVPATGQVAHSHCRPTKFRHYFCQTPKGARCPIALWDLKQVQKGLTAYALQAVEVDFSANTFQPHLPSIDAVACGHFGRRFVKPF